MRHIAGSKEDTEAIFQESGENLGKLIRLSQVLDTTGDSDVRTLATLSIRMSRDMQDLHLRLPRSWLYWGHHRAEGPTIFHSSLYAKGHNVCSHTLSNEMLTQL